MEAWQLALLAWEGLKLLGVLIGIGVAASPTPTPDATCYQARVGEGALFCPHDITGFTLLEPDEHWMVRR